MAENKMQNKERPQYKAQIKINMKDENKIVLRTPAQVIELNKKHTREWRNKCKGVKIII